jgi:hypothetical protein
MSFPRSAWVLIPGFLLAAMPAQADFSVEGTGLPGRIEPVVISGSEEKDPAEKKTGWSARLPVIIEGEAPQIPTSRISPEKAQPVSAATLPRPPQPYPPPGQQGLQPATFNTAAVPYGASPPYYGQMPPQYQQSYNAPPMGFAPQGGYAPPTYGGYPPPQPYAPAPYGYGYATPAAFGPGTMAATPTYLTMYTKPAGYSIQGGMTQPYYPQPYPPPNSYYGGTSGYGYGAAPMPMPAPNYMGPPYGYGPPPGSYYATPHSGYQSYPQAPPGGPVAMPQSSYYGNAYPTYTPPPEPKKKKYKTPAS